MTHLRSFLRDRRGTAMVDYVMVGALVMLTSQLAARHGMAMSGLLRSIIGA